MIKVLELFAGIGACSKALENLKIEHEIVDAVEIDKYAIKSFNAIHDTNFEPQDITLWDKDLDVDLIMHGSPCQDFSLAGKQAGGDKDSGTRSSLLYETLRIVEKLNPKYVIWENVKNLLSKKHKHNFDNYVEKMEELGYTSYYQVLNAKDYGIPQNRERVFTISIKKDIQQNFEFPSKQELKLKLKDMLEDEVDEKYYLSGAMLNYMYGVNQKESKFPRKERFEANINRKNQDIANSITTNAGNRPTDNFIKIKNANKKGYDEAFEGDSVNLQKPTLTARGVGEEHSGMITYSDKFDNTTNVQEQIITYNVPQMVKVRKYNVNTDKLLNCLVTAKQSTNMTNKDIADALDIPQTQVEHYFRNDNSFAIPSNEIWLDLKKILNIDTDEFDKAIMTYELKQNVYDTKNRVYDVLGIAPTLDTSSEKKIINYKGTEVELPAICASRGRNLENPNDRTSGLKLEQTIEVNTKGVSNTLTTFQKDNYVLEPTPNKVNAVENDIKCKNLKQQLCDYLINNNKVKENDMIRHSYSSWRMDTEFHTENSKNNNISATLTTRPDTLGVTVKDNSISGTKLQQEVCNKAIQKNLVQPNDVIEYTFSNARLEEIDKGEIKKQNKENNNIMSTLVTQPEKLGVTVENYDQLRIRKLTPKECWRLMGFDDESFEKAEKVNSNSQLYKQAGNSIVVNVLEEIFKKLLLGE